MGFSSNPGAVQMPTQAQAPSMAQPTGPNVFQQSASALSQAQNAAGGLANFQANPMQAAQLGPVARMGAVGQVGNINAPGQIGVNQLSNLNVGSYMNPFTNQVINRGQQDIERQRQMASNALGAEATAAGAFGGSRQAVQEGVLAGEAARAAGDLSAQQRQAGFNQALQSGQFDIGNIQNARTLASQQGFQANSLNQQAAEAAAARLQGAYGTNAAARNQFALQQGNLQQQANQANYGGQFNAANVRQGASGLLGNLAQTGYGFGTGLAGQQAQQGAAMQGMNQSLIDAARNQYSGFTGAPANSLQAMLAAVGQGDMGQRTETTSQQRGLFDWLQLAASVIPRPM